MTALELRQGRGKSGLQEPAQQLTAARRKARTSATESMYSSAVVKSGKLCAEQEQIGGQVWLNRFEAPGSSLEAFSNKGPR